LEIGLDLSSTHNAEIYTTNDVIFTARRLTILDLLFGSGLRAQLLTWLYTHTDETFYVRQLEAILGGSSANISRELKRLKSIGLVSVAMRGNQKHYTANDQAPAFEGSVISSSSWASLTRSSGQLSLP